MTFDFTFSYRFLVLDLTRDISISLANYQWIEHGGLYWKAHGARYGSPYTRCRWTVGFIEKIKKACVSFET